MEIVTHPDEVWAMIRYKLRASVAVVSSDPDIVWLYEMLDLTSRSFAAVVKELNDELRDAVMIFYLTLRALDTVEDDMRVPLERRVALLEAFHERLVSSGDVNIQEVGEAHEATLVQNLDRLVRVYSRLKPLYQEVIKYITQEMGKGMREFALRPVVTMRDWDLYCHYVAGLVGIGLTKIFARSGLEDASYETKTDIANEMGLFLQKTNIIRDYLEDLIDNRSFWPKETWSKYATQLSDLRAPENTKAALTCLNDLITNAFAHVPACLEFMAGLKEPSIIAFACIPQVMAIATLTLCYDNYDVFTGVVKIRKGEAVKLVLGVTSMPDVYAYFDSYARVLAKKIRDDDPNAATLRSHIARILEITKDHVADPTLIYASDVVTLAAFVASGAMLYNRGLDVFARPKL